MARHGAEMVCQENFFPGVSLEQKPKIGESLRPLKRQVNENSRVTAQRRKLFGEMHPQAGFVFGGAYEIVGVPEAVDYVQPSASGVEAAEKSLFQMIIFRRFLKIYEQTTHQYAPWEPCEP